MPAFRFGGAGAALKRSGNAVAAENDAPEGYRMIGPA